MKLYIAGPMTGLPAFNYPAFDTAEHQLQAAGYEVLNPARRGVVEGKPWEDYLREALADVCAADGVALLPGHQNSRGVALERHVAEALGLDVRLLEVWLSPEVRLLRDVFAITPDESRGEAQARAGKVDRGLVISHPGQCCDGWCIETAHVHALDEEEAERIVTFIRAREAHARAEALREAADAWQWGQWADAPRCPDRVQERIANAQHVTDWLRARVLCESEPRPVVTEPRAMCDPLPGETTTEETR